MRLVFVITAIVITAVVIGSAIFLTRPAPDIGIDTETHTFTVVGYYGDGLFGGELLQSDTIRTNITQNGMSQSIVVGGRVCATDGSGGRVFLNGAKTTEPDAFYEYRLNGVITYTSNVEVGDSSVLTGCLDFPQREFILQGQHSGNVRVNLFVYVHSFLSGSGRYELLAYDTARLT